MVVQFVCECCVRGLKFNYFEVVVFIIVEVFEGICDGWWVEDLMSFGVVILMFDDVFDGVLELIYEIQVEGIFFDGIKFVIVYDFICGVVSWWVVGEYLLEGGEIEFNVGWFVIMLIVVNIVDCLVQVGSYFYFFEVNVGLCFD